jgi:deoxyribonuclease-4
MAGKGSEVGGKFEQLRAIIDAVGRDDVGVCLDTCHVYDGGYDIVQDLDGVLAEFDRIIGLKRLKALHVNDSKNPYASHKDRHACLGEGSLGLETFRKIVNHPVLRGLPMILETPNELPGYKKEIELLRSYT